MTSQYKGIALALFAFLFWGLAPLYWQTVQNIPATELLLHRIIWAAATLAVFLMPFKGFKTLLQQYWKTLILSSALILFNWYLFVWAINNQHIVDASLGYFINPLINVFIGVLWFKERLSRPQKWSIGLCALAILILAQGGEGGYWISLSLALSFAAYGGIKKQFKLPAAESMFTELLLALPFALLSIYWLIQRKEFYFIQVELSIQLLLFCAGLVTILPLLAFVGAVKRVELSLIGLMQYTAPSLQFILGFFFFHEEVAPAKWGAILLIWIALLIKTSEELIRFKQRPNKAAAME